MNSNEYRRNRHGFSATGLATVLLSASLVVAKSYDIAVDTMSLAANGVGKPALAYAEDEDTRNGLEGRAHVEFVVTTDGRAIDPVGGKALKQTALATIADWNVEAGDAEIANTEVAIRVEDTDGRSKASRKFMR